MPQLFNNRLIWQDHLKCDMSQTEVTLKEITKDTVRTILKLSVSAEQQNFVSPNAVSISQAYFEKEAWFRAIYAGDEPVGFVMTYEDPEKAEYELWRFMIDQNHQGKGYGRQALQLVVDRIKGMPNAAEMTLHVVPENESAARLYEQFGFVATGKVEWGENEYKLIFNEPEK